jgi:hypothetical protein
MAKDQYQSKEQPRVRIRVGGGPGGGPMILGGGKPKDMKRAIARIVAYGRGNLHDFGPGHSEAHY